MKQFLLQINFLFGELKFSQKHLFVPVKYTVGFLEKTSNKKETGVKMLFINFFYYTNYLKPCKNTNFESKAETTIRKNF